MKRMVALLAAAAVVVSLSQLPTPTRAQDSLEGIAYQDSFEGGIRRSLNAISGQYIVVYNDEVAGGDVANATESLASDGGVEVTFTYEHALRGFAASMSEKTAQSLSEDPRVAYVEEDSEVEGASVQSPAPPGLDRIDQRDLPLDNKYAYFNIGSGVNVYVIDSGIRTTHTQFGGRASVAYDGVGDGQNGQDCFGHGTHVAGIVGGSTYGVAKNVQLKAVRVLNCSNAGSVSQVVAGIDWVAGNHTTPSAALLSISTGGSLTLDNAVIALVASGVTSVVAAGNNNLNAGTRSPARVPEAITVGAVDQFDTRAVVSNFGSVLDLFAPGVNIESADWANDTATLQRTGTSMAAAFTAGVVARYLSGNPGDTPADVALALTGSATAGRVINPGAGSPNLLLYQPQSRLAFDHYTGNDPQIFVMNSDGSGVTQLTSHKDYNLLWSPDGTKISFISERDGNAEIYVMNADGSGQTRLTNNSSWDAEQVWSPDGSKIAFVSERDGNREVYVVSVSGGTQTRLTNNTAVERAPEWSPSGAKIAFGSTRTGVDKIWTMNADGSSQTQLTTGASSDYNAKWSPDGTKLTYTSGTQIGVINADGTNQHNATSGTAWWNQFPVWAPDSNRILFMAHCPYGCSPPVYSEELFVVNADGTSLTRLTTNDFAEGDYAWTPDGTKITFWTNRDGDYEVYSMNADGTAQTNLTNNTANERGAVPSPGGNKIAFTSDRNSFGTEIFSMKADGAGVRMLTNSAREDYSPVWSPDGTKVAYSSAILYGAHDVYAMKPDGTGQTNLTNNTASDYSPAWSPDGSKLAFVSDRDGNQEIYTMNADGTGQTRLTNNSYIDCSYAWSPDGTKIAFSTDYDDIYLMNADGTNKVNLTNSTGNYGPVWSPDGTKIAFNYYGGPSGEEIFLMNADGSNRTQITNNVGDDFGPSWSPDGSKIATQSESPDGTFEIYIMNSDGTGRTRLTFNALNGPGTPTWQPL
jgi:Tol biopolymer transport system component